MNSTTPSPQPPPVPSPKPAQQGFSPLVILGVMGGGFALLLSCACGGCLLVRPGIMAAARKTQKAKATYGYWIGMHQILVSHYNGLPSEKPEGIDELRKSGAELAESYERAQRELHDLPITNVDEDLVKASMKYAKLMGDHAAAFDDFAKSNVVADLFKLPEYTRKIEALERRSREGQQELDSVRRLMEERYDRRFPPIFRD